MGTPIVLTDPRYLALQRELVRLNIQVAKLLDIFSFDNCDLNIWSVSKGSVFTDTEVPCQGFNLIQVSTDGDLSDVSYKLHQLDGRDSHVMQARESPHIIGPVTAIRLSNAEAEAGKTIRVSRYRIPLLALAAVKHGTASATSPTAVSRAFYAEIEDYTLDATNVFSTDQALTDTATLYIDGAPAERKLLIHTIKWQIYSANAVTYQLYLLEGSSATDDEQEGFVFFDSGSGLAGGTTPTIYVQVAGGSPAKLPVQVNLESGGCIYYMIDWSAAPGNTVGYIKVYGEVLT